MSDILTCADLDQAAAENMAEDDNALEFGSGCNGAALKVAYAPATQTLHLHCAGCNGHVAEIAVAPGPRVDERSPNLVRVGQWSDGTATPDESAMTHHAVKTHLTALNTLPQEVRNNVVVSVLVSFLLGFTDPARELASMAEQISARLPELLAKRDLLDSEPQGQA